MIISPFVFLSPLSPPHVIAFVLFPLLIIPVFPPSRFQGAVQPFCLIRGGGGGVCWGVRCVCRGAGHFCVNSGRLMVKTAKFTRSQPTCPVHTRQTLALLPRLRPLSYFSFFHLESMHDRARMRALQTPRATRQLTIAVYATRQHLLIETFCKRGPLVAAAGFFCLAQSSCLATLHKSNPSHAPKTDNARYLQ